MGEYSDSASSKGNRAVENKTTFGAEKSAGQRVSFTIDPSKGLSKLRYLWYSNGTLHDNTNFTEDPGEITLATTATGSDTARIHSSFAGQYVSHTLSEPGLGVGVDAANVSYDADDRVSLSHGQIDQGPFMWASGDLDNGLSLRLTDSAAQAVVMSEGSHVGGSPVDQADWNMDTMDGNGPSGAVYRPDDGVIPVFPHTWYNRGPLFIGFLDNETGEMILAHKFDVEGQPSMGNPNLPVQLVIQNGGTATALSAGLGGMQYTTFGAGDREVESRETSESRITSGGYIADQVATTDNAIDPDGEPGKPLVCFQRQSGEETVAFRATEVQAEVDNDCFLYFWVEWDPGTALTGATFNSVVGQPDDNETKLLSDTQATDYTPTDAVFIGRQKLDSAGNNKEELTNLLSENRVPMGATLVTSIVHDGSAADASFFDLTVVEDY